MSPDIFESRFDVYGCTFSVSCVSKEVIEGIRQDFAFFAANPPHVRFRVELFPNDPPSDGLPTSDATVYTPRNVVYRNGDYRYIDYHGRALGIREERTGNFRLYSKDSNLLYEAAYLYLLSQIGQFVDGRGMHRIHALGVVIKNRAVLVLLPMGGGKSTLGLHLLKHPEVKLLSDDSPLIDRKGRVFAYPLRLGLLPGSEGAIPEEHRRVINRMEFGVKHLVNYSYFQDRVCPSAESGLLVIGARTLGQECRIEKVGSLAGLHACVANCVIGVGLFQGLEFILRSSGWELTEQAGLGYSRLRNCHSLVRRSRICRVHLGRDPERNASALLNYALHL